jgi:hypothetical protein
MFYVLEGDVEHDLVEDPQRHNINTMFYKSNQIQRGIR